VNLVYIIKQKIVLILSLHEKNTDEDNENNIYTQIELGRATGYRKLHNVRLMTCILHQILLELSNQGWQDKQHAQGDEKHIQNFSHKT
jgi:hypothetical protein